MLPGISSAIAGARGAPEIKLGVSGSAGSASALTTYTFTNCDIGAEAGDRYVIVGIGAVDTATDFSVNSVTINGVNATSSVDWGGAASGFLAWSVAMFAAKVPTGTSVSIVVTFSEAVSECDIAWLSVYDLASAAAYSADADGSNTTNFGTSTTNNVATVDDCLLVSFMYGVSPTWDNGIEVLHSGGVNRTSVIGAVIKPTVSGSLNVTATHASARRMMASAVFR